MNVKLPLIVVVIGVLLGLSTAQRNCTTTCDLAFRCSPYHKDLVWGVQGFTCRVFQNGCFFASENCQLINRCEPKMEITTREKCLPYCRLNCGDRERGVCAMFPITRADGSNGDEYKYFINRCYLNRYACMNSRAYVGEPMNGPCPSIN